MAHEVAHEIKWEGHYEQFGAEHPVEFQNMILTSEGTIQGGGQDGVGAFTISGTLDSKGGVQFKKAYPTHAVEYAGTLGNDGKISGTWSVYGQGGKFEIHMKTKQWKGDHANSGGSSLAACNGQNFVVSLDFSPQSVSVKGIGHDERGAFTIVGSAPKEFQKKAISLEKRYFSNPKEKIFYAGVIYTDNGQDAIKGTWQSPSGMGDFKLVKQN